MSQPAGDPVTFHRRPDGLADNESDVGRRRVAAVGFAPEVHDNVGLCHADPVLHRRVKLN
ncbi:hypothetical protein I550_5683 [Mycobacterium intracellulare 1956]|uniref:Uncharacterized protein n=1 Tax=Mycobacterium intracellulare 1956 TaxID=1299331 RepID=X8CFJ7_MYCIT|nr:hypothetical protein OCQ_52510 [Mycobacterium paraintracellulare]EUA29419.1 hypothetical protein I548_2606 [Mycobacterium intracellulare]EUA54045.1 hypothetical protein I550_5683 [Mycobacterium intracellulare 1956]